MIPASKVEDALRLGREAIRGLVALQEDGSDKELDNLSLAASTLWNVITILDLFLTGGARLVTREEYQAFFLFLSGKPSARILLSDEQTSLVLQWPTEDDQRVIYPTGLTETPQGLEVRRLWQRIDNPNSESVEFPPR